MTQQANKQIALNQELKRNHRETMMWKKYSEFLCNYLCICQQEATAGCLNKACVLLLQQSVLLHRALSCEPWSCVSFNVSHVSSCHVSFLPFPLSSAHGGWLLSIHFFYCANRKADENCHKQDSPWWCTSLRNESLSLPLHQRVSRTLHPVVVTCFKLKCYWGLVKKPISVFGVQWKHSI